MQNKKKSHEPKFRSLGDVNSAPVIEKEPWEDPWDIEAPEETDIPWPEIIKDHGPGITVEEMAVAVETIKKPRENTLILVVFDRSGSMQEHGKIIEARNGYNRFISEQKKLPGKAFVTLATFDDQYDVVCKELNINDVVELKEGRVRPRGQTRLYDAIGKTIAGVSKENDYDGVILLITTDGLENDSKKYTSDAIRELLAEKKSVGWEVIFSGSSEESVLDAQELGIVNTIVATDNVRGEKTKWDENTTYTTSYRAGN